MPHTNVRAAVEAKGDEEEGERASGGGGDEREGAPGESEPEEGDRGTDML
jgi:hypothetical protein